MDDDIVAYLKEKLKAKNTELYDLQRSILHQNHEGGMPEEEVATRVRAAAALVMSSKHLGCINSFFLQHDISSTHFP